MQTTLSVPIPTLLSHITRITNITSITQITQITQITHIIHTRQTAQITQKANITQITSPIIKITLSVPTPTLLPHVSQITNRTQITQTT